MSKYSKTKTSDLKKSKSEKVYSKKPSEELTADIADKFKSHAASQSIKKASSTKA